MDIVNICKKISTYKNDIVFVGGISLVMHGFNHKPKDIDVVVNNLEGLETLGIIKTYTTNSMFSKSGNRAYICLSENIMIDIFIEEKLPEFDVINGLKFEKINSMIKYYENLYPLINDYWKQLIYEKLQTLKSK